MHIDEFKSLVSKHLEPAQLMGESGAVLYSRPETLRPGDYYILGLNPGGNETDGQTIRERLNRPAEKWVNAYTEENWSNNNGNYKAGEAPLQRRLYWLLKALGNDLNHVCASNLIFMRTPDAASLEDYEGLARACWPVHKELLGIVQPKGILTFGNGDVSPYHFLQHLTEAPIESLESCKSGHGNWQCKAFVGTYEGQRRLVIGLPHLSRYNVIEKSEVVKWIKDLQQKQARQ